MKAYVFITVAGGKTPDIVQELRRRVAERVGTRGW
jgi:hypothetical protein